MEMAQHVWDTMKGERFARVPQLPLLGGHGCGRSRVPRARKKMETAQQEGKTCIDCHKGIAHLLPKEYKEEDEE